MLNESDVLFFIKSKLGYPVVQVEVDDKTILYQVRRFTIPEFSKHSPRKDQLHLNTNDPNVQTGIENVYYIHDKNGTDILNVYEVVQPMPAYFVFNYPFPFPFISQEQAIDIATRISAAKDAYRFSGGFLTFEFMRPDKLRISPMTPMTNDYVVRYEALHLPDFSSIQPEYQTEFLYLALADVMSIVGHIRTKYQSISTPFGEIPLGGDVAAAADALKDKILDRLRLLPPNEILYVG